MSVIVDNLDHFGLLATEEDDCFSDVVELGLSKEVISEECYRPVDKTQGWRRTFLTVKGNLESGGVDLRMYIDGSSRFLLSAKQLNNDEFLISNHEDFPLSGVNGRERIGFGASMCRQHDSSFLIKLNHCTLCDAKFGRFTCGRGQDREIVARIAHSVYFHKQGQAEMRTLNVWFPYLNKGNIDAMLEGRRTWCPRTLLETGPPSMALDTTFHERIPLHPNVIRCTNKLPVWNESEKAFILSFQANRVLSTSVFNFILFEERRLVSCKTQTTQPYNMLPPVPEKHVDLGAVRNVTCPTSSNAAYSSHSHASPRGQIRSRGDQLPLSADQAILQFGLADNGTYILDFKYPLSALQAFGVAISSFAFDTEHAKNRKKGAAAKERSGAGKLHGQQAKSRNSNQPWSYGVQVTERDSTDYDSDASDSTRSSVSSIFSAFSTTSFDSQASSASGGPFQTLNSNFSNLCHKPHGAAYVQNTSNKGEYEQRQYREAIDILNDSDEL